MLDSTDQKRIAFLKEHIMSLNEGKKRLTWEEYGEKYEHSRHGVRKWWRRFLDIFLKDDLWFKGYPIENDWMIHTGTLKDVLENDKAGYPNAIGQKDLNEKWVENLEQKVAFFENISDKPVRSVEEAMAMVAADPAIWEVYHYESTVWSVTSFKNANLPLHKNNYRNHIKLRLKKDTKEDVIEKLLKAIDGIAPRTITSFPTIGEVGVLNVADFHLGAQINNLSRTSDFSVEILISYLHEVAEKVNRRQFSEVHVNMLGDFFESISGLNHADTFKGLGLGMYGANLFILADKIFSEHFLSRINNLKAVNIVGGNHDRLAADKRQESTSEGAGILAYLLQKTLPSIEVSYNHSILVKIIDGIQYILFHGDTGVAKQDSAKVILDYGLPGEHFTCLVSGHRHTREHKRTMKTYVTTYKDVVYLEMDEMRYRKYQIASLFTGNIFSENLGHASTAGALVTWNNGRGKPEDWNLCLS